MLCCLHLFIVVNNIVASVFNNLEQVIIFGRAHSIVNTSKFTQQCNVVSVIMQFTGCQQPVQRSHSPENAIDWLA